MDHKDLDLIIEALNHATQVIELAASGKRCAYYEDFEDQEIRDMYYKIMDMCLTVYNKRDGKECATCVYYDTDRQDQPCYSCYDHINYEKMEEE